MVIMTLVSYIVLGRLFLEITRIRLEQYVRDRAGHGFLQNEIENGKVSLELQVELSPVSSWSSASELN